MIKNVCYGLCAIILLVMGCDQKKTYTISGTWENGNGKVVYLKKETREKQFQIIDSAVVKDNQFKMTGNIPQFEKYLLALEKNEQEILLDGEPIKVVATQMTNKNGDKIDAYKMAIQGSHEQKVFEMARGLSMSKSMVGLGGMFAMVQVKDDSVKLDSTYKAVEMMKRAVDERIKNFVDSNSNSLAITYVIGDFIAREYPFEDVERYYNNLTPEVKASYPGQLLKEKMTSLRSINVGGIAPDIDLMAPDGKHVKLSSLRGKYVLLDFWASWCGPCLAEVPNVKAVYEQYKDKGFEIYGVSLDDKKDAWVNAIEKHDLPWIHVSSLKGWECPVAKIYNVTGIPKMYLLDKEGRIVAMDLRGEALKEKVASFFN
ncbi:MULTISPECIES: redoxin domain-containing protein [unclassified Butyricimonas]|uniref:redoxin domain-containing protein n=1 Tax=unclassified Butyricimonas TaxID=2637652 RepID=UPI0030C3BBB0